MADLNNLTSLLDEDRSQVWTLEDAVALCRALEELAPLFGAHVALTGGCLYKNGRRKDVDIMFYRIRQQPSIDEKGLLAELVETLGFKIIKRHGWVVKAIYDGKPIDLFFPEEQENVDAIPACTQRYFTGDKPPPNRKCEFCYQKLEYHINTDSWGHGALGLAAVSKQYVVDGVTIDGPVVDNKQQVNCDHCDSKFYYTLEYNGKNLCPSCFNKIKLVEKTLPVATLTICKRCKNKFPVNGSDRCDPCTEIGLLCTIIQDKKLVPPGTYDADGMYIPDILEEAMKIAIGDDI